MGRTSELMIEQELSNCGISSWSEKVMCPHCRQIYIQDTETQMPGFRDKDYDICPYCGETNGFSMSVEYHNYKVN